MSYWQLYYHVIWATKRRLPILVDDLRDMALRVILDRIFEQTRARTDRRDQAPTQ
jgi:REP element-mobilizing transposase RayT